MKSLILKSGKKDLSDKNHTYLKKFDHKRYYELDSLRGLAAFAVFLSHFIGSYIMSYSSFNVVLHSPIHFIWDGESAVTLFFLLSGFVLSLPFINNNKPLELISFYFKRIFRIYPAFLFALIIAIFLQHYFFNKSTIYTFSDFVQGLWNWDLKKINKKEIVNTAILIGPKFNEKLFIPVIWSLVLEMKMSLLLPFYIIVARRTNFIFNIIFLFVSVYFFESSVFGIFYFGILLAKYKNEIIQFLSFLNSRKKIFIYLLLSISLYTSRATFFPNKLQSHLPWYYSLLLDYISVLGCAMIIAIVLSKASIASFLKKKLLLFMGEVSYSFYLIHLPILLTFCSFFSNYYILSPLYIFISTLFISYTINYFMYIIIEKPFQAFAGKLVKKYKIFNLISFKTED